MALSFLTSSGARESAVSKAFAQFQSAVTRLRSVRKIRWTGTDGSIDVWILLEGEQPGDEDRIYLLERDFRQSVGAFPLDVHVVPLREIAEENLPPGDTIYEA